IPPRSESWVMTKPIVSSAAPIGRLTWYRKRSDLRRFWRTRGARVVLVDRRTTASWLIGVDKWRLTAERKSNAIVLLSSPMAELRRALRFPFEADAEVAPESSPGATIAARVRQIGLYGCYLDLAAPFEPDTSVVLKIFKPGEYFETKATVIHVQQASGMG